MWWANRDTKKVPFSCRNSAGKRDEEDDFSVVPLFIGADPAPALSHLCNNVLLYNGRIPSMLTLSITTVLHCGSGRRYPAFLRLSYTNRQLSATNEQHLFSRQRLFLDTGSGSFCCLFFILSNFSWFVKCFFDFPLFFSVRADFWRKVGETIHFFCTNCKNQNRMLDFIETRCYTKTQIYFFVSVSRRSLPCISVLFFKSQNFRFCSSDCFPESLASGHVAWLQTNRYQRIDKANKRHSFYLELLFHNASGAFAAEGFF